MVPIGICDKHDDQLHQPNVFSLWRILQICDVYFFFFHVACNSVYRSINDEFYFTKFSGSRRFTPIDNPEILRVAVDNTRVKNILEGNPDSVLRFRVE